MQGSARSRACDHCYLRIGISYFFICNGGDGLPRIGHRRDRRCVIFVVLLVFSSDGGSCGDVGRKFFVMTSNVGMTPKLTP